MNIRFKDIKGYISRIDKISICLEDLSYENYFFISDIPDIYDDLYVHGIGVIQSEFPPLDSRAGEGPAWKEGVIAPLNFEYCLEILLHKNPRTS